MKRTLNTRIGNDKLRQIKRSHEKRRNPTQYKEKKPTFLSFCQKSFCVNVHVKLQKRIVLSKGRPCLRLFPILLSLSHQPSASPHHHSRRHRKARTPIDPVGIKQTTSRRLPTCERNAGDTRKRVAVSFFFVDRMRAKTAHLKGLQSFNVCGETVRRLLCRSVDVETPLERKPLLTAKGTSNAHTQGSSSTVQLRCSGHPIRDGRRHRPQRLRLRVTIPDCREGLLPAPD